jgi:hypothetical protein
MPITAGSAIALRWEIWSVVGVLWSVLVAVGTMRNRTECGDGSSSTGYPNINPALQVFASRNWLQMGWINAMADPAEMIKVQTFRDRSDDGFVRDAMCQLRNAVRLVFRPDADPGVSMQVNSFGPEPASRLRVNLNASLDAFFDWYPRTAHVFHYRAFWNQQQRQTGGGF